MERKRVSKALRLAIAGCLVVGATEIAKTLSSKKTITVDGGCEATVYDSKFPRLIGARGVALPKNSDGDSVIFIDGAEEKWTMYHEIGHAEQICEDKEEFWINYLKNRQEYEAEATQRGKDEG